MFISVKLLKLQYYNINNKRKQQIDEWSSSVEQFIFHSTPIEISSSTLRLP